MPLLSIVIPLYNEETVGLLLDKVVAAPLSIDREILIVNDGSTDRSGAMAADWIERHPSLNVKLMHKKNGGKGSAVRMGIEHSSGDIVIIQDADLEYDPNDFQKCIDPILRGETLVVYGSRELGGRNAKHSHPLFYLGGIIVTAWTNLLYGSSLTDEATCYKVYDGKLIRTLLFEGNHFEWEPEITAKLLRLGYEIHEVPISYYPRQVSEGKKIRGFDGLHALLTLIKYRFTSLNPLKNKLFGLSDSSVPFFPQSLTESLKTVRLQRILFWVILFVAFIARLAVTLPGLEDPELLMRPDSPSYLHPALSLAENFTFSTAPGSGIAETSRTPGYPLFLAMIFTFLGKGLWWPPLVSVFVGTGIVALVYAVALRFLTRPLALLAAALIALNLTAIGSTPLYLSDTLFFAGVTLQLLLFYRFYKSGHFFSFILTILVAALTCYIRPANLFWLFPALVLLFASPRLQLRTKLKTAVLSVLLFSAILLPWMIRNNLNDAGFTFSTITGSTLYFHNTPALESLITGESAETIRSRKIAESTTLFNDSPDSFRTIAQQQEYYHKESFKQIKAHPFIYFFQHIRPYILLPDLPTVCEEFGVTLSGRGTFAILNRDGIAAAVNHYFQENKKVIYMALPLLLVNALMIIAALFWLCRFLWKGEFYKILIFLAFGYYYLFIPGPIAMPRYQLPALPLMAIFAAEAIGYWVSFLRARSAEQCVKR